MGEKSRKIDLEELLSYGDNLIEFLNNDKDLAALEHFLQNTNLLQSQCNNDADQIQCSIQEYEKKIDACKKKAAAAESESVTDAELSSLQEELEKQHQLEQTLRGELREIVNEISDLERQGDVIEEQNLSIKKLEQDETRAQMKLSLYASVTTIIPDLDDQSKISGHIIGKDKKAVERFEFDPSAGSPFDISNNIWKMMRS